MLMGKDHKCSGFTLIELMIGLAILGLLVVMAMPSYQLWIANTQIRTMTESIQNGLLKARQEAVHRNASVQFVLSETSWSFGCELVTTDCPVLIESKSAKEGTNESISVTPTGPTTVVFNPFGRRKLPAAASGILTIDIDSSAVAATDSRDLRITVNSEGGVRMCDPNVSEISDPRKC